MDIIQKIANKKINQYNKNEFDQNLGNLNWLLKNEIILISFNYCYDIVFFVIDDETCKHIPLAIFNSKIMEVDDTYNKIMYNDIEIYHSIFQNIYPGNLTFPIPKETDVFHISLHFKNLDIYFQNYYKNKYASIQVEGTYIKNIPYIKNEKNENNENNEIDKILADRLQHIDSELKNILLKLKQEMLNDVIDFLNARDEEFNNKK